MASNEKTISQPIQIKCEGLEIDPVYCDVIIARYIAWCGNNGLVAQIKTNGTIQENAR